MKVYKVLKEYRGKDGRIVSSGNLKTEYRSIEKARIEARRLSKVAIGKKEFGLFYMISEVDK